MNDKHRQSSRSQPRRTTGAGLRAANDLAATVRDKLQSDPLWTNLARNGAWICPYCLSAVRGHDETRAALVRAIEGHLGRRCTAYRAGAGSPQPGEIIASKKAHEDIAHLALTDPAWQVFDHEGYWYSPSSLTRVHTVRIANGRFDSFTIQNMVTHLHACPQYQQGIVHPVEAVQRARDQALRAVNLTTNLRQLVQFPLWRYADATGRWVCPFCLGHIGTVTLRTPDDWQVAPERMADHLAFSCASYVPERPEPKTEAQVQAAAAQPSGGQASGTRAWRTPSNLYPMPSTAPTARNPVATPVTAGPRLLTPRPGTSGGHTVAPPARSGTSGGHPQAPQRSGAHGIGRPVTTSGAHGAPPVARPVSGGTPIVPTSPIVPTPAVTGAGGTTSRVAVPISQPAGRAPEPTPPEPDAEVPAADDAQEDSEAAPVLDWMDVVESTQESTPTQGHDSERIKARDIQKGLLTSAPEIEGFRFGTRFEACHDVSGDFYEFIRLADGRIGFAQGDVSGHGLHAGLIMSMAKKTLAIYGEAGHAPSETLAKVNDSLAADLGGKIFISMVYAILDPIESTITWARAGHNPIIRYNVRTEELTELKPRGMVVGMKAGQVFRKSIEDQVTKVEPGDMFVIYTDGITETMNRQQLEYGTELLNEVIRKHAAAGPEPMLERIMDSVRQFRGGTTAADDLTLLALAVG